MDPSFPLQKKTEWWVRFAGWRYEESHRGDVYHLDSSSRLRKEEEGSYLDEKEEIQSLNLLASERRQAQINVLKSFFYF